MSLSCLFPRRQGLPHVLLCGEESLTDGFQYQLIIFRPKVTVRCDGVHQMSLKGDQMVSHTYVLLDRLVMNFVLIIKLPKRVPIAYFP